MFDNFDQKIDRSRKKDETDANMEVIRANRKKKRIPETNFIDVFGDDEILNDRKLVARLEEKFRERLEHLTSADAEAIRYGERLGNTLEIMIAEQGEEYGWAGENAHFIRASRYDDTVNGIDLIIEFDVPPLEKGGAPRRIALGVDASQNLDAIQQKISRNMRKLTREGDAKAPELKYFQSAVNPNVKGPLEVVIPVIIGLEKANSGELINLIGSLKSLPKVLEKYPDLAENVGLKTKEIEDKLRSHPAQVAFYRQIRAQLDYYLRSLTGKDMDTMNYRAEIESILATFKHVRETKKEVAIGHLAKDRVLTEIESYTAPNA